jgi:regulator of RNase E activity RraA
MRFPVFAMGMKVVDSAGRSEVIEHGKPIVCGDVYVKTGNIVYGDVDGVIVIPQELEARVVSLALEKAGRENVTRDELLTGLRLRDVYDKYQTL